MLANLTGGMFISSAERIQDLVSPGGLLVVSGFDEDERGPVREAFAAMQQRAYFFEDGWAGLVLEKSTVGSAKKKNIADSGIKGGLFNSPGNLLIRALLSTSSP